MAPSSADVLIIGGGPAGLATALALSRKLHSVLLFDSQEYRNDKTSYMHNVLGFDHVEPAAFRASIHDTLLQRYTTNTIVYRKIIEAQKLSVDGPGTRFEVTDEDGIKYQGDKLVLATGVRDIMPSIDGYSEHWGQLIFHCMFCHGYEERGVDHAGLLVAESSQLLSHPRVALLLGKMVRRMAGKVTLFTHGNEDTAAALRDAGADAQGFSIECRPIRCLERAHSTADARNVLRVWLRVPGEEASVDIGFLTHIPDTAPANDWTSQLGLEVDAHGVYKQKDATMETTVPGVFVAGDHASMGKDVPNAASNATYVASAIAVQLTAEH
ncbi:FAD/NAD(P)-binding domain-containing protein [Aspergillus sclerotiicarbonarius CBS 121057]|uniref:FAD/NAD(P)-binding domain-containing protein n=1 Tax=Aspergillus sclerotiicarbonarius (strain CBS 121057 / IBT 28362) TaxID=1448318 RepID=A0A319DWK4_ASPSB|nr:FAD/NAD(P)-binding domain-containing protein [Aspergillus sclerotiicarbonarius CBS 121057]